MASLQEDGIALIKQHVDVSRETEDRLVTYVNLLQKWQRKINLVSSKTLDQVWMRHILDSAQIFPGLADADAHIMDIGSGAGLPGLITAILRKGAYGSSAVPVTLVESDQRKCAFLATAAQACDIRITIQNKRLESLPSLKPDVITARALAGLEKLLAWTALQHHSGLKCVFLKGAKLEEELTCLQDYHTLKIDRQPSLTSHDGVILTLTGFQENPEK